MRTADLLGGITITYDKELPLSDLAADIAEFVGWHQVQRVDCLDGFNGYQCVTFTMFARD